MLFDKQIGSIGGNIVKNVEPSFNKIGSNVFWTPNLFSG